MSASVQFFIFIRNWLLRLICFSVFIAFQSAAFDTVIIDAGHGAHDRGASRGYIFEKHMALDTSRRVEQLLRQAGLRVIMTRRSDTFLQLHERSAIGNSMRNALFVSIHYNDSRSGSGNGVETFYCHDSSYLPAAYVQAYLVQRTGLFHRGVKHASYHVIRETTRNPAILVECGFISNSTERQYMMSGSFRNRVAEGIAQGIIAYKKAK
jgi:N-acetylmuramoyl-L-alanine amidase